jgi:hypothetical protein
VTQRSTEEPTTEGTPRPYPGADDPFERGRSADGPRRWRTVLAIVVVVLVLLMIIALHLTGAVGPGAH